jgi:hypothetical protein
MNSRWNKSSETFPCEQPPQDSYVSPPPPTSRAALRRFGKDLWKFDRAALLSDQQTPILSHTSVWRSPQMRWLVRITEYHLFPKLAAMHCDECDRYKNDVRQRKVITVGMKSGTVRTKFCDECAATVAKRLQQEDACQAKALELAMRPPASPPMVLPVATEAGNVRVCLSVAPLRRTKRLGQRERLENAAIRKVVLKAVRQERRKAVFTLFGRGHEPRVSLSVSIAAVLRGLDIPRVHISGYGANYYYPRRVFVTAAKMLRKKLRRSPIVVGHTVYRALKRQNY